MNLFKSNSNWSNFFGLDDSHEEDYQNNVSFCEVLKKYRLKQHLTASELAERSSVSQSYISQIENNLKMPSESTLEKLAYGLVNYDYQDISKNFKKFKDSNHEEQYIFFLEKLKMGKELTRIKDMPLILRRDDLLVDESELDYLTSLFFSLDSEKQKQALDYMEYLQQK